MKKIFSISLFLFSIAIFLIFGGCVYIQKRLDLSGIRDLSSYVLQHFKPGSPEKLETFLSKNNLAEVSKPDKNLPVMKKEILNKWELELKNSDTKIIRERLSFSYTAILQSQSNQKKGKSYFYIFRRSKLEGSKTILWVPGMGVNDFAFRFIKSIFVAGLERGYNIVFFVPPFHLERIAPNKEEGEGFFTANTLGNLKVILNSVKELRTMIFYLNNLKVKSIGGWGGSMGATMLMLCNSAGEKFDHLALMIPVLNWNSIVAGSNEDSSMLKVQEELQKVGFSKALIYRAYGFISPASYPLTVRPNRVLIQYAKYDQLTPPELVIAYTKKRNIKKVEEYNKSHATILLSSRLYENYEKFLDNLVE